MTPLLERLRGELYFEFTHAGGPGGQHVNKASTQAVLCWPIAHSRVLTAWQKQRLLGALHNRIGQDGLLRLACREHRSQSLNREAALARLDALLTEALRPRKSRRPTKPSRASRERRLEGKKKQAERKANRKWRYSGE